MSVEQNEVSGDELELVSALAIEPAYMSDDEAEGEAEESESEAEESEDESDAAEEEGESEE